MTDARQETENATRPLRIARALVEVLAPRVAVAFFTWTKPPCNAYVTFYPVDLLPMATDEAALNDPRTGHAIFAAAVGGGSRSVSLALYGGDEVHVPWSRGMSSRVWPPALAKGLPPLPPGLTTSLTAGERVSVRAALARLDVGWLESVGRPHAGATAEVLRWTADMVSLLASYPGARLVSLIDEVGPEPRNYLAVDVVPENGATRRVSWPGREAD